MTRTSNLAEAERSAAAAPSPAHDQEDQFVMGLVTDPTHPEGLAFNVYASVAADGTGYGSLTDPVHPAYRSDLRFHARRRRGGQYQWEGVVTRSNDPRLVGRTFVLSATVQGESASPLELEFLGRTFRGRGLVVIAIIAVLMALLLPAIQ